MPLRLIGGVAVRLRAGRAAGVAAARRTRTSISSRRRRRDARGRSSSSSGLGYDAARRVQRDERRRSACSSSTTRHDRQVDVFVGSFSDVPRDPARRAARGRPGVDPARRAAADEAPGQRAEREGRPRRGRAPPTSTTSPRTTDETSTAPRVAELCADDWGLWRTITLNLDAVPRPSAGPLRRRRRRARRSTALDGARQTESRRRRSRAPGGCARKSASASAGTSYRKRLQREEKSLDA